jgi:nitric oxide reductase NorE protein
LTAALRAAISRGDRDDSRRAPAILVFIGADMMMFALFFAMFMLGRREQVELFDRSAAMLNADLGMLNTLILVTSSWLVVQSVHASRLGQRPRVRWYLMSAFVVGALFGIVKFIEYRDKFSHGISMLSNDFFMFYFVLTGIHFLHFAVGMAVLAMLWVKAGQERVDGPLQGWIESGGLYWHMVDLLWIVLFPMLYLLGTK